MRKSLTALLLAFGWAASARADEPAVRLDLRVLYVGNADTPRGKDYADFLRRHCKSVDVANREGFDPARARPADVVLLDWSQSDPRTKPTKSPLGKREAWDKPTVLLGSAGHLLAAAWEVRGGSG
jgi:hypothetical protein